MTGSRNVRLLARLWREKMAIGNHTIYILVEKTNVGVQDFALCLERDARQAHKFTSRESADRFAKARYPDRDILVIEVRG